MSDKIDIENKEPNEYNINEFNNNIFYINDKQNLKLDFNFRDGFPGKELSSFLISLYLRL